jgi:cobalt-zinc-cadmium efflux system outer membrane protein
MRSADSTLASARADLSLARRSRVPAPALRFGFETGDPTGSETGILPTVGISIPLPLFDRGGAAVDRARAGLSRADAERAMVEREVAASRASARRRWEAARRRLSVDGPLVQDALDVARQAREAYREGAYPLSSVLDAQRSARDVLRRRIEDLTAAREAVAAYRLAVIAGGATP